MNIKKVFHFSILLFTVIFLSGCSLLNNQSQSNTGETAIQNDNNQIQTEVQKIDSQKFDELAQKPETFIVDVHTPEQTHIPGTDAFIDYTKIKENQSQFPTDKSTPIVVYCRSGSMSAQASKDLAELGYINVYDLEGGTNAYKQEGSQSVEVTPDSQPLGTVIYGDVPETEFILTNYTDSPLKITRLSTSCGCTQASMEEKIIPPYGTAPIRVTFDPAVHKDDSDLGELTRIIYIETDSPQYSKVETTITANVVKQR